MCCFLIVAAVLLGLGPGLHSQNEGRNWAIVLRLLLLKAGVADSHGLCVPWLEYLVFLSAQLRFIPNWLICHVIGGEPVVTWRYFYWEEAGVCAQVVGWIPELALCCRSFLQIDFRCRMNFCSKCFSVAWISDSPKRQPGHPMERPRAITWAIFHFILFV